MGLSALEQRIAAEIGGRGDKLVELASALIRFDTEAREPEDAPREEAALQQYLAGRLGAHTIDEYVVVDDLVECAQELAIAAVRFCGLAS